MKPKVSIIVPVYNMSQYLNESIGCLIHQTLKEIEIVCVDDCSTDNSKAMLKDFAAKDKRFNNIYFPENRSVYQARKEAVAVATGEYIMFLDSDDRLELDACEKLYKEITKQDVDILEFGVFVDAVEGISEEVVQGVLDFLGQPCTRGQKGKEVFDGWFKKKRYTPCLWNKIYRTSVCKEAIKLMPDGKYCRGEDIFLFFFISWNAISFHGIVSKFYHYNYGRGMSGKLTIEMEGLNKYLTLCEIEEYLRKFLKLQKVFSQYEISINQMKVDFTNDSIAYWLNSVSYDVGEESFSALCETWGKKEIIFLLHKYYSNQLPHAMVKSHYPLQAHNKHVYPYLRKSKQSLKERFPIVLATNNHYAPYASVTIQSILENMGDDVFYDIYILHTELWVEYIDTLEMCSCEKAQILCLNVDVLLDSKKIELYEYSHYSKETYYRFLIPELFPESNSVVYLDCDLVVNDSIQELFHLPIENRLLASVLDLGDIRNNPAYKYLSSYAKGHYFNAGVLVFNSAKWNEENLQKKCFEYSMISSKEKFLYLDQDILNIVVNGNFYELTSEWNFMWQFFYDQLDESEYVGNFDELPKIIHYSSVNKPWTIPDRSLSEYFWKYARNSPFYEVILKKNFTFSSGQDSKSAEAIAFAYSEIDGIHKSVSYRLGRLFTFFPRKIRGGIRCYKEHGMKYTFRRIIKKTF